MNHESEIQAFVPYQWSQNPQNRKQQAAQCRQDLLNYAEQNPDAHLLVNYKLKTLATQGPYFELISLYDDGDHPSRHLLEYLSSLDENLTNKVVRRIRFDKDELVYEDPLAQLKRDLNLVMMNHVSFKKLQKLLVELYYFGNQKIPSIYFKLLPYVDYLECSMKTITKAMQIDDETLSLIQAVANNKPHQTTQPKHLKLLQALKNAHFLKPSQHSPLLNYSQEDSGPHNTCIFTRQQLYQYLVLFALLECEALLKGKHVSTISKHPMCTDDYSWNENCWPELRDYHPKLAKKLNKRYNLLRDELPYADKQTRIAIMYYAQSLLGYYHHNYHYSQMKLNDDIKTTIYKILHNQPNQAEIPLLILVSNARMYTQILYALYQ